MTETTDCQLLHRFVHQRDEAAFTTLARRHAARVLGVCRRVLRDEQEAEDVAQATFVVLARKAAGGGAPWHQSIGPWLSAVAHRLALNVRGRRRCREQVVATLGTAEDGHEPHAPGTEPVADAARRELCGVVRDAVALLPEKYRVPVELCYLEGKTNEQAAHELGWPAGSMSRRLEKARDLLRRRLNGRGLALLGAVLGLVLASLWLTGIGPRRVGPVNCVAECRDRFGAEDLLRRLIGDRPRRADRDQVVALATAAADFADRIQDHDPGTQHEQWRRDARDMGLSARMLASAVEADDRPATQLAAARLHAACNRCHHTFRE